MTLCPLRALTRAASNPPGPPPTMTTFDERFAGAKLCTPQRCSRSPAGLIVQPCAPSSCATVDQLHAMQIRLRSSLPSRQISFTTWRAVSIPQAGPSRMGVNTWGYLGCMTRWCSEWKVKRARASAPIIGSDKKRALGEERMHRLTRLAPSAPCAPARAASPIMQIRFSVSFHSPEFHARP